MIIKGIVDEDFVNYRLASMFIIFPYCTFKCERECGITCCQNSSVALSPNIEIEPERIVERYLNNPISKSLVFGGLEPLDSFPDVIELIGLLREKSLDTVVIYTGYKEDEVQDKIDRLKQFKNIVVKFGRFIPNQESRFDQVLGINLASPNQYTVKIS